MWARWSDMLFSRKKFTRKHGRHGQTLKIYFSRTNWFFLTKTWGVIRELLLYPKYMFTDFWNNGKWKKQNVAQIQLPVTCGTCNTLHFELIRAVITVVVNNVPPAFNKVKNTGVIEWRRHCIKKRREGCFHFRFVAELFSFQKVLHGSEQMKVRGSKIWRVRWMRNNHPPKCLQLFLYQLCHMRSRVVMKQMDLSFPFLFAHFPLL